MDREPLEISAEKEECSHPSESGEDGTEEATLNKRDTLSPLLLPPQQSCPWFKPEDTELINSQNYPWLSTIQSKRSKEPSKPSNS